MAAQTGYDRVVVMAYIEAHATKRDDGRIKALNEIRLTDSHREMLGRWEHWDTIPLAKVDAFLMHYDSMLFELEDWAREKLGTDGFIDPFTEPVELAI